MSDDKPMTEDERERFMAYHGFPSSRYYDDKQTAARAVQKTEAERQKYHNWQDALYAQGMPVAGHGEPVPLNDPERNRGRSR